MKNQILAIVLSAAAASLLLTGCGDSSSGSEDFAVQEENKATLENGKVVYCDSEREGVVAALADGGFRRCKDGLWVKISNSEALKAENIIGLESVKSSSSQASGTGEKPGNQNEKSSSSVKPPKPVESSSSQKDPEPAESSSSFEDTEAVEESCSSVNPSKPVESSSSSVDEEPVEELYECEDGSFVENLDECEVTEFSSSSQEVSSSSQEASSSSCSSETGTSSSVKDGSEYDPVANTLKDLRDGQTYKTVKIRTQTWMAENLNYDDYNGVTVKSYCYNNSVNSCAKYGRLYLWSTAMDSAAVFSTNSAGCGYRKTCTVKTPARGVCPEGWHIPTSDEWSTLYSFMGNSPYAMQATGFEEWSSATDAYGFSALPAGYFSYGSFYYVGSYAHFWSSAQKGSDNAGSWGLYPSSANLSSYGKNYGLSVRCLQDSDDGE